MVRIIAFDPGGTTGWAMYYEQRMPPCEPGEEGELIDSGYDMGQLGPDKHHIELKHFIEQWHEAETTVVCERFDYRWEQRAKVILISRDYCGVIELTCLERNIPLVMQGTGNVIPGKKNKAFWTDEKIKKLGLWFPGHPHAMDALRHLLYYRLFTLDHKQLLEAFK